MKRPQYVFRPNLNEPQHRRAWALLQQVPPAKRKEFLVQSILAAEQTDRLEKSIRKVVREELQAVNISSDGKTRFLIRFFQIILIVLLPFFVCHIHGDTPPFTGVTEKQCGQFDHIIFW